MQRPNFVVLDIGEYLTDPTSSCMGLVCSVCVKKKTKAATRGEEENGLAWYPLDSPLTSPPSTAAALACSPSE